MDSSIQSDKENPNKTKKRFFTKKIKGIASLLKHSSNFWKGTLNDFGKNICQCTRQELDEVIDKNQDTPTNPNVQNAPQEYTKYTVEEETKVQVPYSNQELNNDPTFANNDNIHSSRGQSISQHTTRVWLPEEDKLLINFINRTKGRNWKKIASILQTKTPQQCSYRYNHLVSTVNKKKFNRNDDILLIEYVENLGKNWNLIAQYMEGHIAEDLKERYEKKLDPSLKRSKFAKEEDEFILQLHEKHGNNWKGIAKYFPDRNAYMIRNRYYSFLQKKQKDNSSMISNTINTFSETSSIGSYYYPELHKTPQEQREIFSHSANLLPKLAGRRTISYNDSEILKSSYDQISKEEKDGNLYSCEDKSMVNSKNQYDASAVEEEISAKIETLNMMGFGTSSSNFSWRGNSQNSQNLLESPALNSYHHPLSIGIDDHEENFLSKDLAKIETDSPKDQVLVDKGNNFNEHYYNTFWPGRNCYDESLNEMKTSANSSKIMANKSSCNSLSGQFQLCNDHQNQIENTEIENKTLTKQYQKLEEIFQKIDEFIPDQMRHQNLKLLNINADRQDQLLEAERQFEEKKTLLSSRQAYLKAQYLSLISQGNEYYRSGDIQMIGVNNSLIKNSILMQIELLIELINTSKTKINLIQQIEKGSDTGK